MLKHVYRLLGLIIVFFVALVFFSHNIEVIQVRVDNSKVEMEGETLPIISMKSYGVESNRLYGYVSNTPANNVRETITVIDNSKTLEVKINEYSTVINKLNYEVRAVSDNELIDSGEVVGFEENKDKKIAKINFETDFAPSTEYALKITLVTDVSKKINYYTRIKFYSNECYVKNKIDFVKDFHEMTIKKDENLAMYIEPDAEADNSSFAHVNINSSYENIVWGNLTPVLQTDIVPQIKEINIETAAIVIDYYAKVKTPTGLETYYVSEYYRVRHSPERIYLLWYERNMEAMFDVSLASVNKSELKLGILNNENIEIISNDTVNKVAFARNGNVYMYDLTENKIYNVYQQYIDATAYEHELYRQQNIHIMSIDEEGNLCFAVYGYIAHGAYEGKVAIVLYRYHKSENAIEELLYIPFQTTYQILKENFEEYSYLNSSDVFYFSIDDKIYSYSLVARKLECLAQNIGERNFTIIPESSSYVWESSQNEGLATEITIMNLETGEKMIIEAGADNYIKLIGVMGTNIVSGTGKISDIARTTEGAEIYAMKNIDIRNKDNQVIKSYSKKKIYITEATVNDNVVYLKRAKKANGDYRKIVDDNILNRIIEEKQYVQVTERITDKMKTEKYMAFPSSFVMGKIPETDVATMFVVREEKALYLEDPLPALKYFVYAKGSVMEATTSPAEAILLADKEQGVVINSKNKLVWERGGRFISNTVPGLSSIRTGSGISSVEACVYMLLKCELPGTAIKDIKKANKTMLEIIGDYIEEPVNLTGCTLDEVLYFVSGGKPVIAMKNATDAVLITAYNTTSVTIYDPQTGMNQTMYHQTAQQIFDAAGNIYVSYMKGE